MNLRRLLRIGRLAAALAACMLRFVLQRIRGPLSPVQRALWLQASCRGVLRSLGVSCRIAGIPPSYGLVVSNHLSYLDIVVYGAAMPCFFVSKAEVKRWPYFGRAARGAGSIFLDRSSRASASAVASEMARRLHLPVPLLLFPEGTSTDGSAVLRFHSGLFQATIDSGAPVTPAAIRYRTGDGAPESSLCWFGEAGFFGHVWQMLAAPPFTAEISFGQPRAYPDRRSAAHACHRLVADMRAAQSRLAGKATPVMN